MPNEWLGQSVPCKVSRLTDLIAQAKSKDADLGQELERGFRALASCRSFGLNFGRHTPESVELSGRPISKGDKVRVLPPMAALRRVTSGCGR